ncbi:MAG: hypothetical protein HYR85_24100 [Planctomycetes bacterium]|nr:hypothetical protein [Planctomycetota bacterium]MBI3846405.1 hypothetical protein [Planctomycetota bacterium]
MALIRRASGIVLVSSISLTGTSTAQSNCGRWTPGISPGSPDGAISQLLEFDGGSGPELYASGPFSVIGASRAPGFARRQGDRWSALGGGLSRSDGADVRCGPMALFDDGHGSALFVTGDFDHAGAVGTSRIARWNGHAWAGLAGGISDAAIVFVRALTTFDDGSGPALFVAGSFLSHGNRIARWNGTAWSSLGGGIGADFMSPEVKALAVFDDGGGPALYAAGLFNRTGDGPANGIARWNGSRWSPLGSGLDDAETLAVFDDGTGPALYVGGTFTSAGGQPIVAIARWNGTAWSSVGGGLSGPLPGHVGVNALAVFDDGSGPALFAAGSFTSAGGDPTAKYVARWNGSSWSVVGDGFVQPFVTDLGVVDDGSGPKLFASGTEILDLWDGVQWSEFFPGIDGPVHALAVFDDGSGPALYTGGTFGPHGPLPGSHAMGRWNGSSWSALPGIDHAFEEVEALTTFDDGGGPALYAGGYFTGAGGVGADHVARWNRSSWSSLGSGIAGDPNDTTVNAFATFDDGNGAALYAGGSFTTAGGVPASSIAKWNGSAWSALGAGVDATVRALTVFDDGTGPALYAGGQFHTAGGFPARGIARWNGSQWSAVGNGHMNGSDPFNEPVVRALTMFDDGTGPGLVAVGEFNSISDVALGQIGRWRGGVWQAIGDGLSTIAGPPFLTTLASFDDGNGPVLWVGGSFDRGGVQGTRNVARLVNGAWQPCGLGFDGIPFTFCTTSAFAGPALFAGGGFSSAGGIASRGLAQWRYAPREGNVNASAGAIAAVLTVNGSAGDADHVVHVAIGAPILLALARSPAGPQSALYVLWAWAGHRTNVVEVRHLGTTVGCLVNPSPLHAGLLPQPIRCLRGANLPAVTCQGVTEVPSPARAPWTLVRSGGLSHTAEFQLQGLMRDDASGSGSPFSVTNAVVLRVE